MFSNYIRKFKKYQNDPIMTFLLRETLTRTLRLDFYVGNLYSTMIDCIDEIHYSLGRSFNDIFEIFEFINLTHGIVNTILDMDSDYESTIFYTIHDLYVTIIDEIDDDESFKEKLLSDEMYVIIRDMI